MEKQMMNYRICWLTVNRACNLKCKWCYAKDTNYQKNDDIDIKLAYDIVDLCEELKINHITLIGGEPTIYPNLPEVISYSRSKKISCGIVTNGVKLADINYIKKLMKVGQDTFSISLKGENRNNFLEITGQDRYEDVLKGISNCISLGAKISVSMVLTEDNIDTFLEGVKELAKIGVNHFYFSFCYEFDTSKECKKYLSLNNPRTIVRKFTENYETLNEITNGKFHLFESFPLCLWERELIEKLNERKQIKSVCQLLRKSGLIFDSKGNLIPCNAMPNIKLGTLHKDFRNAKGLMNYVKNPEFISVYNTLCSVPDEKCLECIDYVNCGGGCVCHWTNYTFNHIMNLEG